MPGVIRSFAKVIGYGILGLSGGVLALSYRPSFNSQFPDELRELSDALNKDHHPILIDCYEIRLRGRRPDVDSLVLARGVFGGIAFTPQRRLFTALYKWEEAEALKIGHVINSTNRSRNRIIWDPISASDDDWQLGVKIVNDLKLMQWDRYKNGGKMVFMNGGPGMLATLALQTEYDKERDETILRMGNAVFNPDENKEAFSNGLFWLHCLYSRLLLQDAAKYIEKVSKLT